MAILASFLGFWLQQEYEREKQSLVLTGHLQIATAIISDQGEDLKGLVAEIEALSTEAHIQVAIGIEDTLFDEEMIKTANAEFHATRMEFTPNDSTIEAHAFRFDTVHNDSNRSVWIQQYTDSSGLANQFIPRMMGAKEQPISPEVKQQALLNVWPQAVFAVLLFALLLSGIVMLQYSYRKRQELLAQKNSLISNLTHELKTPVSTVAVALEAIEMFNADPEKSKQYIQTSRKEIERLTDTIDMVMQLSLFDQNAAVYQFETVDLHSMAETVLELMEPKIAAAAMLCALESDGPLMADVDRTHFQNALINLVDNAVKHADGKLAIRLEKAGDTAKVIVRDSGPGIDPKYQAMIFDRFYRVTDGDQHNTKGHGLGLSYVKEVVEAHGGSIAVKSELAHGAQFEITIPTKHVSS